jgi:NIPSNAP
LKRFEYYTLQLFEKHGIKPLGLWTVAIGECNNDLYLMLEWQSLAEREQKFAAFLNDPEWLEVRRKSEENGPLESSITKYDPRADHVLKRPLVSHLKNASNSAVYRRCCIHKPFPRESGSANVLTFMRLDIGLEPVQYSRKAIPDTVALEAWNSASCVTLDAPRFLPHIVNLFFGIGAAWSLRVLLDWSLSF